jgi:CheY-like chemotaxis protein
MGRPCDRTVLVVDDDVDIRITLTQVLEDEGCQVVSAANGAEALAALRSGAQPCLVLLDLMMPVCDGIEFRAVQLSDPQLARIPVVVITADREALERAQEIEAAGVLAKPLTVDALLDAIERHCTR